MEEVEKQEIQDTKQKVALENKLAKKPGLIARIKEFELGPSWKQPGRIDVLLVLIFTFSWYLFNDMFNLLSIDGLSTTGNFFGSINIPAAIPFALSFIVMIAVLLTFVIRSTFDKDSHRMYNTIVGTWILFGVVLMIMAMVLMLQGFGPQYRVSWFLNFTRNGIYHLGVFLFQIPGVVYFALFK